MESIKELFKRLPEFGWASALEWRGDLEHIEYLHKVLSGHASMDMVFRRAAEIRKSKESGEELRPFNESADIWKQGNDYLAYMLGNYKLVDGDFILPITLDEANDLAAVLLGFKKAKQ